MQRISQSKSELETIEKKNSQDSRAYAQKLEQKEQEVKSLRTQVASQQRLVDEQLLGIDKIKERVEQWSAQSKYQKQLLIRYSDTAKLPVTLVKDQELAILDAAEKSLENTLMPRWVEGRVVSPDGKILNMPQLALGPLEIAIDAQNSVAGPITHEKDREAQLLGFFSGAQQKELMAIKATGSGELTFDPTLENAYKLMHSGDSLMTHLVKGGTRVVPIIIFGILAFLVSIIKGIELWKLPKIDENFIGKINASLLGSHDLSASKALLVEKIKSLRIGLQGAQAKLVDIVLQCPESQYRDDLMAAYLIEYRHRIERFMGVVATSAAVAPLLGLLGTVSGMISMFKMMTVFGSGDISTVSGGISEALITTELGLVVAIPSLVVSALLTRRTKSYNSKLETFAIKLSKMDLGS
ncbi:MAG TPA: MotA/TolQ/ExbB proton channel family protein [Cellvibrionaceae bacterium]